MPSPCVASVDDLRVLESLKQRRGLFLAAPGGGYDKLWLRDNVYVALGYEAIGDWNSALGIYRGLLDIIHRYSWKIDWALWQKPRWDYEYLHPRYTVEGNEIHEPWGFKQNDAIGLLMFRVAVLEKAGMGILRDHADRHLLQKLVWYLDRIDYSRDRDNGMWEEAAELHASSVAACVRALEELHGFVCLPEGIIEKGRETLDLLLPKESPTKQDLAQLSLVWPLGYVRAELVERVERRLLRERGVLRYENDWYHRNGSEAEWTMGLAWLGQCWLTLGDRHRARQYLDWTDSVYLGPYLPECYAGGRACEHTPLAWAHALALTLRAGVRQAF